MPFNFVLDEIEVGGEGGGGGEGCTHLQCQHRTVGEYYLVEWDRQGGAGQGRAEQGMPCAGQGRDLGPVLQPHAVSHARGGITLSAAHVTAASSASGRRPAGDSTFCLVSWPTTPTGPTHPIVHWLLDQPQNSRPFHATCLGSSTSACAHESSAEAPSKAVSNCFSVGRQAQQPHVQQSSACMLCGGAPVHSTGTRAQGKVDWLYPCEN